MAIWHESMLAGMAYLLDIFLAVLVPLLDRVVACVRNHVRRETDRLQKLPRFRGVGPDGAVWPGAASAFPGLEHADVEGGHADVY